MSLVVVGFVAWVPCSVATALLVARGIRLAEREDRPSARRTAYPSVTDAGRPAARTS